MTPPPTSPDDDDYAFSIEGPARPLIRPGIYTMTFGGWATELMFDIPKLVLHWHIHGQDNLILPKYYNVLRLDGSPRIRGRFKVSRNQDLTKDYIRLFGDDVRLDRMPMSIFTQVKGRVGTVESDCHKRPLPKPLRYSVVRELLEVVMPDETSPY